MGDPSPEELLALFRRHGISGEVREVVPREGDEAVFVVTDAVTASDQLIMDLQRLLDRKVWVVLSSPSWIEMSKPVISGR